MRLIALRSAGFDHVDLAAAKAHNITVVRVPKYSPQAIAEFTVALILSLNRKIIEAYEHGLKYNFLLDHLLGFNLFEKTIGIIGTGHIGTAFAEIMTGFKCKLLAHDPYPNETCRKLGVNYVSLQELLKNSDVVSLHCLLNSETHYMINAAALAQMKPGAMLINTGRGALIDTKALIQSMQDGHLGYAGLDVYEDEHALFFKDHAGKAPNDQTFLELQALPNVLITPHQAFFTKEAVQSIATTTIANITAFEKGQPTNQVAL